jgi:hypothetical protein
LLSPVKPTVNVNGSEKASNEGLEGAGEVGISFAYAIGLDSLLKLIS